MYFDKFDVFLARRSPSCAMSRIEHDSLRDQLSTFIAVTEIQKGILLLSGLVHSCWMIYWKSGAHLSVLQNMLVLHEKYYQHAAPISFANALFYVCRCDFSEPSGASTNCTPASHDINSPRILLCCRSSRVSHYVRLLRVFSGIDH
jgi:hypothetical protein